MKTERNGCTSVDVRERECVRIKAMREIIKFYRVSLRVDDLKLNTHWRKSI